MLAPKEKKCERFAVSFGREEAFFPLILPFFVDFGGDFRFWASTAETRALRGGASWKEM